MFNHILVPLDGSDIAEKALRPAAGIASAMSARLTLLRVVPQFALLAADPMVYEEMNRLGEDEALSYLRSKADGLGLGVKVESVCETGQPADAIIQYAEENDVDLIMMSSHGRSGLSRWVYGSVAERVMRRGPCATAIINARVSDEAAKTKKILIPLDGSDLAERALEPGRQLGMAMGAELHLLRVNSSTHQMLETASMSEVFDEIEHKEVVKTEEYLEKKKAEMALDDVHVTAAMAKGTVAEAIFEYAAERGIDLIIMSSHGRTGLQRWVYGSVAEKVLRGACCATMIIRDPRT